MTRPLTDHEAAVVRRNPGMFPPSVEKEAWDSYFSSLRVPMLPVPLGPRLVVDNSALADDGGYAPDEIARNRKAKADFDDACPMDDMGLAMIAGPIPGDEPYVEPTSTPLPEDLPQTGRLSFWDGLILVAGWAYFLLPFMLMLAGCTAAGRPPECRTCIGAYDVSLTSHREALQ